MAAGPLDDPDVAVENVEAPLPSMASDGAPSEGPCAVCTIRRCRAVVRRRTAEVLGDARAGRSARQETVCTCSAGTAAETVGRVTTAPPSWAVRSLKSPP
jgi:hypothetical protein